jgi:general L-amino acid transport system substrate-binding protein
MAAALVALAVRAAGTATPPSAANAAAPPGAASTFQSVRAAGELRCGVVVSREDWNKDDLHGDLSALGAEICKAVGIAALGERARIELTRFNTEAEAEQSVGESRVDLVVGVTPTASAAWRWHVAFGPPVFYDGLGILIRSDVPGTTLGDLAGRKICVIDGTDNDHILEARVAKAAVKARVATWQEEGELDDAMRTHWCDAVGAYVTRLVPLRNQSRQLANARILPELLTLSPIAPAYRQGDPQWSMLVDWTIYALIQAEASGITRENVAAERSSEDPVVQRLLGVDWATSRALGLPAKAWGAQVIAAVGNYGEIYERTASAVPRGPNALWLQGGLMHPLPFQ